MLLLSGTKMLILFDFVKKNKRVKINFFFRLDDCKYDAKKLPTPLLKLALYDSKYPYIGVDFNRFTRLEVLICNLDFPVWIPNFLDLSANLKVIPFATIFTTIRV